MAKKEEQPVEVKPEPKKIILAFAHVCVDKTDKLNHKLKKIALGYQVDEPIPDETECPHCGEKVKKGLATPVFYSEGTV